MELGGDRIVCGDSLERAGMRAVSLGIGLARHGTGRADAARPHRRGRIERRAASPGSSDLGEPPTPGPERSEEHTSELQSHHDLVCRLLLEKKKKKKQKIHNKQIEQKHTRELT